MTDPTRPIGTPMIGLAPVAIVERSPTGIALLGQNLVRVASAVGALAVLVGGVIALFLPAPWAVTGAAICASVALVATKIEAMGPGIRTQAGAQPALPPPAPISPTDVFNSVAAGTMTVDEGARLLSGRGPQV